MSRFWTASTRAAPMPGYWKTNSTTTTPPAIHASWRAATWIAGTIAFGTACLQITCRSGRPFNRAIVTYSLSSTSTIEPRMMRLMYGTTAMISVAAGSTTTWGSCHAFSPGASSDTAGNQWNRPVAKMRIRQIPITNSGSAARTRVTVDVTWSAGRSRFIAVHTPMRIDSGMAMIDAMKTRNTVLATRSLSSWLTGCCVAAELPKSNVRMPLSHCVYWVTTDSLRCSCSRRAAIRSGVASLPRIAVAASPGSASTAAKTTSEMRNSVRTPRASRRATSLVKETHPPEAVVRQRKSRSGGVESADRVAVGIHLVAERPDDQAAPFPLDPLRLLQELRALGVVQLGACLPDEVEELGVLPVGLVERRVRQAPLGDLAQVRPRGPEVLGEGPLQAVVAVEGAGVDLAHVDRHT